MSLDVVGKLARVTAEITPGHLGEVMIEVRQGTERFLARAADKDATIPKYTQVLVVGSLGGRTVEVSPTDAMRLPRLPWMRASRSSSFSSSSLLRCSH